MVNSEWGCGIRKQSAVGSRRKQPRKIRTVNSIFDFGGAMRFLTALSFIKMTIIG